MPEPFPAPSAAPPDPRAPAGAPPPATRRRRVVVLVIAVVVVAALVAGAYAIWHARAPAAGTAAPGAGRRGFDPNAKPAPVAVATAKSSDFNIYLTALGTVTPRATVTVRSRVDGQLLRVQFTEGETVKAGQLLAQIDPRSFEVMVAQANGQLAKDRALLANANVDLDRYKTLLAQDSIARQQVDTQASLVRQYEASIATDQGQVDAAKLQLSYTRITAPVTGRLGLRQVDVGNMVHASDANGIVLITTVQPIDVVFSLPETNLPQVLQQLRAGKVLAVEALSRDQTQKLADGKVLTVDNQIDTTTGTVKLKAEFANDDSSLFPNQFVNVRMLVRTMQGVVVVPSAAIQRGTQGAFVYVVGADSVVTVRLVTVGPVNGETTVIAKGLAPGDVVVIDGTDRLREGQKVETVSRDTTVVPTGAARAGKGGNGKGGKGNGAGRGKGANADAPATRDATGKDATGDKGDSSGKGSKGGGAAPPAGAPATAPGTAPVGTSSVVAPMNPSPGSSSTAAPTGGSSSTAAPVTPPR